MKTSLGTYRGDCGWKKRHAGLHTVPVLLHSMLYAKDPNAATHTVSYSFGDNHYKKIPSGSEEHVACHFSMQGSVLHTVSTFAMRDRGHAGHAMLARPAQHRLASPQESDDAAAQMAVNKSLRESMQARRRELERQAREQAKSLEELLELEDSGGRNQFNYSERAAQTYMAARVNRGVTTKPPTTRSMAGTFSQWDLYDTYMVKFQQMVYEEEAEAAGRGGAPPKPPAP